MSKSPKNPVEQLVDHCNAHIMKLLELAGPAAAKHKAKLSKLLAQARTYIPPEREALQAIVNDIQRRNEGRNPYENDDDLLQAFAEQAVDAGIEYDPLVDNE
jgi:hypothetical protein